MAVRFIKQLDWQFKQRLAELFNDATQWLNSGSALTGTQAAGKVIGDDGADGIGWIDGVTQHVAATNPHTQYARKASVETITAAWTFSSTLTANGGIATTTLNSTGAVVAGHTATVQVGDANPFLQSHRAGSSGVTGSRWSNNTAGPYVNLGKSRGAAVGTNAIVQSGDRLGTIQFCGDDGTDLLTPGAEIHVQVDGTPGANDMPGVLVFSTTADGASTATERMRIDSAGNVTAKKNWLVDDVHALTAVTTAAQTRTLDLSNGAVQTISANQAFTLNVSGPAGKAGSVRVYLHNPSGAAGWGLTYGTGWAGTIALTFSGAGGTGATKALVAYWDGSQGWVEAAPSYEMAGDQRPS